MSKVRTNCFKSVATLHRAPPPIDSVAALTDHIGLQMQHESPPMKPTPALLALAVLTLAAGSPARAEPAPRFTLDSPIEALVADPKAVAVLDTDLPGLTTNDKYDMFKSMSLNQVAGFAPDKLTPERLAKVEADLAQLN